jgi:hypothetical protein
VCDFVRDVASSRGPSRVQAALGRCERRAATLVSGCLLTVGAFALSALAGIVLLQCRGLVLRSLSCGSTSSRDKLQKLRRRRCRCRGAALAPSDLAWLVVDLRLCAAIE